MEDLKIEKLNGTVLVYTYLEMNKMVNDYIIEHNNNSINYLKDLYNFDENNEDINDFLNEDLGDNYYTLREETQDNIIYNIINNFNYLEVV